MMEKSEITASLDVRTIQNIFISLNLFNVETGYFANYCSFYVEVMHGVHFIYNSQLLLYVTNVEVY